jgi:IS605 OrfB family transposase
VVKKIINKAGEVGATVIVMEDLDLYERDLGSRELNGRIHRWSYRRFQQILEYQAKLHGLDVKYVDPAYTSSVCPVCGGGLDLSPNGRRLKRCQRCGLEEDRDIVAVRNLTRRYYEECMNAKTTKTSFDIQRQIDVGSPRSPRKPSNEVRREGLKGPERYSIISMSLSLSRMRPEILRSRLSLGVALTKALLRLSSSRFEAPM